MKPLKITIRHKTLANPREESLYLDFNRKIWNENLQKFTRYHFLELFVFANPKTQPERDHNKFVFEQAEMKKLDIYKQIITETYGLKETSANESQNVDFLKFFKELIALKSSPNTRHNWENAFKKFTKFTDVCLMKHLTTRFLYDFRDFLEKETVNNKSKKTLASNTKRGYFSVILTAVGEAYKRDYLKEDIAGKMENFALKKGRRVFLTEEEIQILRQTPFPRSPVLVRAAFFAILTSLRWDDIRNLKYEQLQHSEKFGWFIDFDIKKTDCPDILYINEEAFLFCEYEKNKTGAIFPLRYREKDRVAEWLLTAGIKKSKGGFHIFRHTFAMRALNNGEHLSTIQALMGHSSIKSTEVYAKILGKTKQEASKRQSISSD